ncbi:hypothetical protein B0H17DRAFT_1134630 [Mycena rosella]|uniref:Uncharacterized protein n=1 Tax=Mycena rosella TaxID=1033263 RepID=A0AAD7DEQ4_MYCRO|nr:hypothetical protein B0H17DRAFT_1134630 [Mycena rosella]
MHRDAQGAAYVGKKEKKRVCWQVRETQGPQGRVIVVDNFELPPKFVLDNLDPKDLTTRPNDHRETVKPTGHVRTAGSDLLPGPQPICPDSGADLIQTNPKFCPDSGYGHPTDNHWSSPILLTADLPQFIQEQKQSLAIAQRHTVTTHYAAAKASDTTGITKFLLKCLC